MEQEEQYNEKALTRILKRAIEMESKTGKPDRSSGYSLAEIESIATDAGISIESIRAAAAELAGSGHGALEAFLGAAVNLEERSTLVVPFSEGLMQRFVAELPTHLPAGTIQSGHDHLHWQSEAIESYRSGRSISLDLSRSREEGLSVVIQARLGMVAAGLFGGIMGGLGIGVGVGVGVGVGIGVLGSPTFAIIVPVASLGISWLLARSIFRSFVKSTRYLLRRMSDEIRSLTESFRQ